MASVRIRVNNPNITASRIRRIWEESVRPVLAEEIKDDCNVYVRKWSGALEKSAHTEARGHYVVWQTGYAKRVYYTGTPRKGVNPNASLRWCEVAKRAYMVKWVNSATALFRR